MPASKIQVDRVIKSFKEFQKLGKLKLRDAEEQAEYEQAQKKKELQTKARTQ